MFKKKEKTQQEADLMTDDQQNYLKGVLQNISWYKKQYQRMTTMFGLACLVAMFSMACNVIQFMMKPSPKYFAQTPDLRITELRPLDEPYITQEGLVNWAAETVSRTFSLDFLRFKDTLMGVRENYTTAAFNELVGNLKSNGTLEMIKEKRLSASVALEKAPVISNSGIVAGVYTWKLEFPIIITYEGSQGAANAQHLVATVLVQRADTITNPKGVVVKQILMSVNNGH